MKKKKNQKGILIVFVLALLAFFDVYLSL